MLNSTDTNQRHVLAFKKDSKRHDIATLSKMPSNLQEEVQELPFENFCLLTYKIDYNYYWLYPSVNVGKCWPRNYSFFFSSKQSVLRSLSNDDDDDVNENGKKQ